MRNQIEETAMNGQANGLSTDTDLQIEKELDADLDEMLDSNLLCPNMEKIKRQRKARAREAMEVSHWILLFADTSSSFGLKSKK